MNRRRGRDAPPRYSGRRPRVFRPLLPGRQEELSFGDIQSGLKTDPETVEESEKSEDVVLARGRGLPEQLQGGRHRIASCLVDGPFVPNVSHGVSPKHHFRRSHLTRSGPGSRRDVGGRTKGVLDPRPWDRINRGKTVSRDHHSFPDPRVRYRVQHIRQKIHCDVGQSYRQDAALDQVVVAV